MTPAIGGSHPGFGTRNSLLSLGDTYLEVISPDPAQSLEGNRGGLIASLAAPGLMTFAVRTTSLAAYEASAKRAGIVTRGPVKMGRTRPDGRAPRLGMSLCRRRTSLVRPSLLPSTGKDRRILRISAPAGCRLVDLHVLHPEADRLAAVYREMGIDGSCQAVAAAGLPCRPRHAARRGRAHVDPVRSPVEPTEPFVTITSNDPRWNNLGYWCHDAARLHPDRHRDHRSGVRQAAAR